MSATEILNELPKLTPAERLAIARKLADLDGGTIDLGARGIAPATAAELRIWLAPFAADWDSPEMSADDHYDAAHAKL